MMATIDITKLSAKVLDYTDAEAGVVSKGCLGLKSRNQVSRLTGQACLLPMGLTSENVAAAYGIPRDRQDAMAADSHLKA